MSAYTYYSQGYYAPGYYGYYSYGYYGYYSYGYYTSGGGDYSSGGGGNYGNYSNYGNNGNNGHGAQNADAAHAAHNAAPPPNMEKVLRVAGFGYLFSMLSSSTQCATPKLPWEQSESELFANLKAISAFLRDKDNGAPGKLRHARKALEGAAIRRRR